MIEFTVTDLNVRAFDVALSRAEEFGIEFDRQKPLWFLAVHSRGAQLRVTWRDMLGNTYTTAEELYAPPDPNRWLEDAKGAL